jgi:S1-C subfamily serine protease
MRFCRNCGNRLGEGPAEYTQTVLLPNSPKADARFRPGYSAPVMSAQSCGMPHRRRKRLGGMASIIIVIAVVFVAGGALSMLKNAGRNIQTIVSPAVERSYFGVDGFENSEGGVTFGNVEPPDSPADKAGLIGGDIVTTFDGVTVEDEDQMMDLLRKTPPHKTVDVVYIRDGETRKTQLTTITQSEYNQLQRAFEKRPQGQARLGFETSNAHRVKIPEMDIYGVRLDDFNSNGPAALAGLEKGDIIIQLNDTPIRTVSEFVARIHRAIPYTTVKLTILRAGQKQEIPVKLGK